MRTTYLTQPERQALAKEAKRKLVATLRLTRDEGVINWERVTNLFGDDLDVVVFYNQSRSMGNCAEGTQDFGKELFGDTRRRTVRELVNAAPQADSDRQVQALAAICYAVLESELTAKKSEV